MTKEFYEEHKRHARILEELAAQMEELNRKMEELLYKYNVSRETNRNYYYEQLESNSNSKQ